MKIKTPNRVTHSHIQTIEGRYEDIFALYCPVKEKLWCEGWNPEVVYTHSGAVERDCVFVTRDEGQASTWFVTQYDIKKGTVEMIKHTPDVTISKLDIALEKIEDQLCCAHITYSFTSLGPKGNEVVANFTQNAYTTAMEAWEKAMNHYLKTGEMLTGLPRF